MDKLHVCNGAIMDDFGGILYDSDSIKDLSPKAKRRLAQLHSERKLDWEHAEVILRKEGLLSD